MGLNPRRTHVVAVLKEGSRSTLIHPLLLAGVWPTHSWTSLDYCWCEECDIQLETLQELSDQLCEDCLCERKEQ